MFFLSCRGVSAGSFLNYAELTDVLPTVLYSLGLPIARDLDGGVLTGAFATGFLATQPLTYVPSYETLGEATEPAPVETVRLPEAEIEDTRR